MKTKKNAPRLLLYQSLVNTLQERIQKELIPSGGALPSERDLCLEFNVSRQTVRNALATLTAKGFIHSRAGAGHFVRANPGVPEIPGKPAERRRVTRQIGLICSPHAYMEELTPMSALFGIKSRLSREGYSLALSVSQKDEKRGLFPCYQHWLEDGDIKGYIVMSVRGSLQRRLLESGYPALSMGYVWEDIALPSIAEDFRRGYEEIILHLARLGHTRIAAMLRAEDSVYTDNVIAGIRQGESRLGWSPDAVSVRQNKDTAYDMVCAIRSVMRAARPPTALVIDSETHLDEVMRFFEIEGIRVPEDLHVIVVQISYPDHCAHKNRIGYYQFDFLRIGQLAAARILDLIAGKKLDPLHLEVFSGRIVDPPDVAGPIGAGRSVSLGAEKTQTT